MVIPQATGPWVLQPLDLMGAGQNACLPGGGCRLDPPETASNRVFVVTEVNREEVVAYYACCWM